MLVVIKRYRKLGLGRELVRRCLTVMQREGADECVLEVEYNNEGALRLYQSLGFIRDKRLEKYYLNGHDAFRMKLRFKKPCPWHEPQEDDGIFKAGLEFLEKEKEKTRRRMEDKVRVGGGHPEYGSRQGGRRGRGPDARLGSMAGRTAVAAVSGEVRPAEAGGVE